MQQELPLWRDPHSESTAPLSPGHFIKLELEKRGWGQADLAFILQRPLPTINEIINAKKTITMEMAVALGKAFNQSPELWAHRETAYRLSLVKDVDKDTAKKAKLFEIAPIKDMQRRGWLSPDADSAEQLESELLKFMGYKSLDESSELLAAARQSKPQAEFTNAQKAWLIQAERVASKVNARPFTSSVNFAAGLEKLRKLATKPENAAHIPHVLAEAGVRFVIVEDLPHTKIDGAAFYLKGDLAKPVVVVSMRFDRMDSFWHTLAHELRHVAHGDPLSLDAELIGDDRAKLVDALERRADEEAADWLIPKDQMDSFILRAKPFYTQDSVVRFASRMGVHPSIVIGQLQHRRIIGWDKQSSLKPKILEHLLSTTMSDGYLRQK